MCGVQCACAVCTVCVVWFAISRLTGTWSSEEMLREVQPVDACVHECVCADESVEDRRKLHTSIALPLFFHACFISLNSLQACQKFDYTAIIISGAKEVLRLGCSRASGQSADHRSSTPKCHRKADAMDELQ